MYKKFFTKILLLIIPIVILILFVNIKVDGGFVINNRSDQIARILVSGDNAGVKYVPSKWGSLQAAIVKERLKTDTSPKKDILVFGTSRSSEIHSGIFPENTFFNCVMPGGSILDYMALYGLYKRHNLLPEYVIISIDPWTFHSIKSVTVDRKIQYISDTTIPLKVNRDLVNDYKYALKCLNIRGGSDFDNSSKYLSFKDMIELFNPNYFQTNIKSLFDKMVIKTNKSNVESYFVIHSDGGYSLVPQNQIDSLNVEKEANKFIKIPDLELFVSSDTSTAYFTYFKKLVLKLKNDKVTPVIYISPINPIVYNSLSPASKYALEKSITSFCRKNNIILVGSFNPHKCGYSRVSNVFIDAYHPATSLVNDLFYQHKAQFNAVGLMVSNNK